VQAPEVSRAAMRVELPAMAQASLAQWGDRRGGLESPDTSEGSETLPGQP